MNPQKPHSTLTTILLVLLIPGCAGGPTINISTKQPIKVEPLKVDLAMRLDVYQHADPTVSKTVASGSTTVDAQQRMRQRMGEIQVFKNSRLVGESSSGLLEIRIKPPGEYGAYVQENVDAENKDRLSAMQEIAAKKGLDLVKVKADQADLRRQQAFTGEWIEVPHDNGTFVWEQKGVERN